MLFPESGRLFFPGDNGGWGPDPSDEDPYLQVQLNVPSLVTGLIIQGRGDQPEYAKKFRVSYSIDCSDFQMVSNEEGERVSLVEAESHFLKILKTKAVKIEEDPKNKWGHIHDLTT